MSYLALKRLFASKENKFCYLVTICYFYCTIKNSNKMTEQLFTGTAKKKAATTMYEVNDNGRSLYDTSEAGYLESFIGFLESLDFEVQQPNKHDTGILIDGTKFKVDLSHASYASRNAFTREHSIRKQQNRFVGVSSDWLGHNTSAYVAKVYINKELDTEKLRSKILAGIQAHKDRLQSIQDMQDLRVNNTQAVGEHYFGDAELRAVCKYLYIEKGTIFFRLHGSGSMLITAAGKLIEINLHIPEIKSLEVLDLLTDVIAVDTKHLQAVVKMILDTPPISEELQVWSVNQYHRYFYTETMLAEK